MAIYQDLEITRKTLHQEYKDEQKKGYYSLIGLPLFIILLFAFFDSSFIPFLCIVGIVVSFLIASIFFAKAARVKAKFASVVKNEFVDKVLLEHFVNPSFQEKNYIPLTKILKAGLTSSPDRYNGEDLITGTYKNIDFQVSDVILTEKRVVRTGKTTTIQYIDYFKGRWYIYKFKDIFPHALKIFERGQYTNLKGLKKYETEMIDFNKKFQMYSSDEHFFYYIMDAYMIERFLLLEKSHRGTIHYSIVDDELHIGINDNSNSLQIDFNKEINEGSLARFMEDIVLIKTIIDELRLYDVKFKN